MTTTTRLQTYEMGATHQFTWVSSVAPDSAPRFSVTNYGDTVVTSITAQQSSSTAYWALFTMPNSAGYYVAEWLALKTINSSAYQFVSRDRFLVTKTIPVP